ncbi:Na(+)-translocating NADH-quinone reductase subunit A [Rubinisphaera sp.]|uniref:Na(+)-translocating NADH-quinone reductase subunit A n=1 Tax=Rubinisphaera sp. TaxID=2024857 RepID=UPI000C0F6372|nr:Na(+)-translocating NADH-quinone reductase subunit A [Rubinisphaera sp.]MBV11128.1 NADH:ubiquinone reductase (Na(+)-transporting) subunit A [Rubinisphaera sp.]|tara:strand:+ start:10102 stop:11457 length:1356 start_codon:yes stop_codon:yes gene_type:complete
MIKIKKGLDVPISGQPVQEISPGPEVGRVALIGPDYVGMKPTMLVQEGDRVKLGQPLFEDKKTPGVIYTSPGCGTVAEVNRGEKRYFQSMVIELDGDEEETFRSFADSDLTTLSRQDVQDNLVSSGLWTSLRTRPFNKVPALNTQPSSIFVTAIDTQPLAADPAVVIAENEASFIHGLQVLRHLTDGPVFLCQPPAVKIPGASLDFIRAEEFAGPHPAGLPGTHIHYLDPVGPGKKVWFIGYQDVIAIGKLFDTGRLSVERIISLAGPIVNEPRLIRTRIGASIFDIVEDQLNEADRRVISGSVLSGRTATGPYSYLGRYHNQISALAEGREREFLGWQMPGFDKFSIKDVYAASMNKLLNPKKRYDLTTSTGGSKRAMVPIGMYEAVMPLDILPTFLLRALIVNDSDQAQALGCLELDEDDVSLCTFVCPGKYEYGSMLRRNLSIIESEG